MPASSAESAPTTDPDDVLDHRIVRLELGVACATFVTATLLSTTGLPSTGWWSVPLVALGWGLLTAAADRSRLGRHLLYAAAALAMIGIVWWVATGSDPLPAVPLLLYGLGIGSAANRLLFGVIRPVPEARRLRQRNS